MPTRPLPDSGFTLLELLVAMAVFTVMSAMAYGGLASLLNTRTAVEESAESLTRLQMAFSRLAADVEQAVPRLGADGMGGERPALTGGVGAAYLLDFTRSGQGNPQQRVRSALQRVAYSVEDGALRRHAWPHPDHLPGEPPLSATLLEEVLEVEIRFLSPALSWQSFWPPEEGGNSKLRLPRAVEITIERKGWGRIRRLFEVVDHG